MFTKVLIATDSSPASLAVVGCARALQVLRVRECVLAQCFLIRERVAFPDQIKAHVEAMKERLTAVGNARVGLRIPFGSPVEEILSFSQTGNASLIVMGSHGRGYVSELFLGSVSHNVARHSDAPILLIPRLRTDTEKAESRKQKNQ